MQLAAKKSIEHIGETQAIEDHDHDLVHELSKRLDSVWRYDQFIANAEDHAPLQEFWRDLKKQDLHVVKRLRELIKSECRMDCF